MRSKEELKKYNEQYRAENKEKIKAKEKQYRIKHKTKKKNYMAQYRAENKDKISEQKKQWDIDNMENSKQYYVNNKEKYKQRYVNNKDEQKERFFKRKYGLTLEQYTEIYNKQYGKCAICGKHQTKLKQALCVDHDHITNIVRGLLCSNCNTGIGMLEDNVQLLTNAIDYLKLKV
jgi:hypothetical protein